MASQECKACNRSRFSLTNIVHNKQSNTINPLKLYKLQRALCSTKRNALFYISYKSLTDIVHHKVPQKILLSIESGKQCCILDTNSEHTHTHTHTRQRKRERDKEQTDFSQGQFRLPRRQLPVVSVGPSFVAPEDPFV